MAQLGARLDGIEEVVGSNPIGSTNYLFFFNRIARFSRGTSVFPCSFQFPKEPSNSAKPLCFHIADGLRPHRLVGDRCRFRRGVSEPGFETRLAESCVIAGKECPFAKLHAVVAGVRVCDNLARVLVCG